MKPLEYWNPAGFEISSFRNNLSERVNQTYKGSGSDITGNCTYTYNEVGFRGASVKKEGFKVTNTSGEDLDVTTTFLESNSSDVTTAFEIFEHLVSPFTVLKSIKSKKLVASIPLRLWFATAYRSKTDPRDCHFHEFEDWQFDWLLEKAGWKIIATEKWTNPTKKIGLRPILRWFIPRYYIVYAERI